LSEQEVTQMSQLLAPLLHEENKSIVHRSLQIIESLGNIKAELLATDGRATFDGVRTKYESLPS
jgi:hypothetical protein